MNRLSQIIKLVQPSVCPGVEMDWISILPILIISPSASSVSGLAIRAHIHMSILAPVCSLRSPDPVI